MTGLPIFIKDLNLRFNPQDPWVLKDVCLQAAPGEFLTFIGPSGCGKTTLLKTIAGLLKPTLGTLILGEHAPSLAKLETAFVFQEPNLLPWLNVLDNVALGLKLNKYEKKERYRITQELLGWLGLSNFADYYPEALSGGMKMRVSLARALALDSKIILMDEPFAALDEITRYQLCEDFLKLREMHPCTVCFVTHSVAEAVFLSDTVYLMSGQPGQLVDRFSINFNCPRKPELRETQAFQSRVAEVTFALRQSLNVKNKV